jgi:hypothetical protein
MRSDKPPKRHWREIYYENADPNLPAGVHYQRPNRFPVIGLFALIVFAVVAFVGIPRFLRRDHRAVVAADLRRIHAAEETYRRQISRYDSYGNFNELTEAGLLEPSRTLFIGCENCDEKNLWTGTNRDFQFEIARNAPGTAYCVAAVPRSKSYRALAISQTGVIYEDDADKISCTTSPAAKNLPEPAK